MKNKEIHPADEKIRLETKRGGIEQKRYSKPLQTKYGYIQFEYKIG